MLIVAPGTLRLRTHPGDTGGVGRYQAPSLARVLARWGFSSKFQVHDFFPSRSGAGQVLFAPLRGQERLVSGSAPVAGSRAAHTQRWRHDADSQGCALALRCLPSKPPGCISCDPWRVGGSRPWCVTALGAVGAGVRDAQVMKNSPPAGPGLVSVLALSLRLARSCSSLQRDESREGIKARGQVPRAGPPAAAPPARCGCSTHRSLPAPGVGTWAETDASEGWGEGCNLRGPGKDAGFDPDSWHEFQANLALQEGPGLRIPCPAWLTCWGGWGGVGWEACRVRPGPPSCLPCPDGLCGQLTWQLEVSSSISFSFCSLKNFLY